MITDIEQLRGEVQQRIQRIKIHQDNLNQLEDQAAKFGVLYVPIHISNSIKEEKEKISVLEQAIKNLEEKIDDIEYYQSNIKNILHNNEINKGITSKKPYALAISLTNTGSILTSVQDFLERENMKEVQCEVILKNGISSAEDIADFINDLQWVKKMLESKGCSELHLFISSPVIAGVFVGSVFRNWKPVKLYHRFGSSYEYWGIIPNR